MALLPYGHLAYWAAFEPCVGKGGNAQQLMACILTGSILLSTQGARFASEVDLTKAVGGVEVELTSEIVPPGSRAAFGAEVSSWVEFQINKDTNNNI